MGRIIKYFKGKKPQKRDNGTVLFCVSLLLIGFLFLGLSLEFGESSFVKPVLYTQFESDLNANRISEVVHAANDNFMQVKLKNGKSYITYFPAYENFHKDVLSKGVKYIVSSTGINFTISTFFTYVAWCCISVSLICFLFKCLSSVIEKSHGSGGYTVSEGSDYRFENFAGNDEIKEEFKVLVNYLKKPEKYRECGARLPKGIIMYGEPGTGKTLMAKCVAGEAGVPFIYAAGSSFVELYVGMGSRHVRSLFSKARKLAPCVVFIDELDAIGSRSSHIASSSEANQTIACLLSELDGFNESSNIVVIAATNCLDNIDPAVVRPGRFDKHLYIGLPSLEDRKSIIEFHAHGRNGMNPFSNIDFDALSVRMTGFSGAMIESVLNEALLIAVSKGNSNSVSDKDIDEALMKVVTGGKARKLMNSVDKNLVAIHEAGHAVASLAFGYTNVHKVTIVPSTSGVGGYTLSIPKVENSLPRLSELFSRCVVLYAGMYAERRKFNGDNSIGARNDIKEITKLIRIMYESGCLNSGITVSQFANTEEISLKACKCISSCLYAKAEMLLMPLYEDIERIAVELVKKETLTESQVLDIVPDVVGMYSDTESVWDSEFKKGFGV